MTPSRVALDVALEVEGTMETRRRGLSWTRGRRGWGVEIFCTDTVRGGVSSICTIR